MKGDGGLKRKMKADGDGDAPLHKHDEEDRGHERAGVLHEEDGAGVGHGVDDELQAATRPSQHCNTKRYSSTYLAMGFANARAGTQK